MEDAEEREGSGELASEALSPWKASLLARRPPCLATLRFDPEEGYQRIEFAPLRGRSLPDTLAQHGFPRRPSFWVGAPEAPLGLAVYRRGTALAAEFLVLATHPEARDGAPGGVFLPRPWALRTFLENLRPRLGGCPPPGGESDNSPPTCPDTDA